MKLVRMRDLCASLGIPVATFQKWVERDPELSVYRKGGPGGGSHWIKIERLAGRHGIGLTDAYMLGSSRWIKAVELAKMSGISRKTIANWCRDRPGFAKRIGRIYYVDLEQMGASVEQLEDVVNQLRVPVSKIVRPRALAARRQYHPERVMLEVARQRAHQKSIPFSITESDIVIPDCCPVLGIAIVPAKGRRVASSPSLDRIVPELGYVRGNVRVISFRASELKRDANPQEIELIWQDMQRLKPLFDAVPRGSSQS